MRRLIAAENARDAEIQHAHVQPDAALVQEKDIVRLDVAMHDALFVRVNQGQQQLGTHLQNGTQG